MLIAPVRVPTFAECWTEEWAIKKDILGNFRMAVGGKTDELVEDDDVIDSADDELPPTLQEVSTGGKKRKSRSEGQEPMFYQALKSVELWKEVIHSLYIKTVVVFTAGDGNLIEACLLSGVPCLVLRLNTRHVFLCFAHMFRNMCLCSVAFVFRSIHFAT